MAHRRRRRENVVERIVSALPDVRFATPVGRVTRHADHVDIDTAQRQGERFDQVVPACHSDQAACQL